MSSFMSFCRLRKPKTWMPILKEIAEKAKVSIKGLSRSSLHAKLMAIDEKQVFIGSFNFDPRSAYLNTEIGVLLDSPTLATVSTSHHGSKTVQICL